MSQKAVTVKKDVGSSYIPVDDSNAVEQPELPHRLSWDSSLWLPLDSGLSVSLYPFADIPDNPIPVDKILRVAKSYKRVVLS